MFNTLRQGHADTRETYLHTDNDGRTQLLEKISNDSLLDRLQETGGELGQLMAETNFDSKGYPILSRQEAAHHAGKIREFETLVGEFKFRLLHNISVGDEDVPEPDIEGNDFDDGDMTEVGSIDELVNLLNKIKNEKTQSIGTQEFCNCSGCGN
jgi:hypothetical protein